MYYVYEWYIVETGEVIYVGKGTNNRYKVRKHNKFFNDMIKRFKCDSRIIKEFTTEKEAFSYEFERIRELKKIGQCVCNIVDGGAGGSTNWWTDDRKEWYSENNAMKSQQQRERMIRDNPMKNKEVAEKTNSQKRIPLIIGSQRFPSIKEASKAMNVSTSTINAWVIRGITTNGDICRYESKKDATGYVRKNNGQKSKVKYMGKVYDSSREMARSIGVAQATASRWCRQGRDSCGNECRYLDDKRKTVSVVQQKQIPIIVNGIWYASKEQAARETGISSYLITQYLKGKRHDGKYICEYGNQQPSRGNTDNSTTEGSTTNE